MRIRMRSSDTPLLAMVSTVRKHFLLPSVTPKIIYDSCVINYFIDGDTAV